MIRFDGNTILICDCDKLYGTQLIEILEKHGAVCFFASDVEESKQKMLKYDFDLIISNYYLNDGLILNLIDWATANLSTVPVFTCFSYPLPGDAELSQKHLIATTFSKNDPVGILAGISNLFFNFKEFHESLLEMVSPASIVTEIMVKTNIYTIEAYEMTEHGVLFHAHEKITGSSGILKFSLSFDIGDWNFNIPGSIEGSAFNIDKEHQLSWNRLLRYLKIRQITITSFMKKAAGF